MYLLSLLRIALVLGTSCICSFPDLTDTLALVALAVMSERPMHSITKPKATSANNEVKKSWYLLLTAKNPYLESG